MSIQSLFAKKLDELQKLEQEMLSAEVILEDLQRCFQNLHGLSPQDKTSTSFQMIYPKLQALVSEMFDIWSTLDDEVEKIKEQLRRLKNFRDLE